MISSVAESLPKAAVESHAEFQLIQTHRAREFANHSCRVDRDKRATFLAMPKRPFQLWPGGRTIGAAGDEHQGAPRYQDWRDGREGSIAGELSDITGTMAVASRRYIGSRTIEPMTSGCESVRLFAHTVNCDRFAKEKNDSEFICNELFKPPGFSMTSPAETALTLVVVKSVAIVGSALVAVLLLAVVGAKRR